ncbi:MAG: pyruvate ferredoxin oxidoreductase [Deltaproteobacteria bacterium]|nr:pyruvate ferredoxin oxidoreductase [Deltaproteobacteria bacterium]
MVGVKGTEKVLEGSEAVAMAVKACRPEVISSYPISPQTHIVEALARMVAQGDLESRYVRVESEFSAASVLAGASAAGARAYTASTSQGLLLMTEVIYASVGMRLPFVMTGVNRALSAPISIQPDHQDAMSLRDSGIIQIYVENIQEAYDTHLAAFKIAEDPEILLPVMVCMDGWVLTHSYERVCLVLQSDVDKFLPPFTPPHFLDVNNPESWGPIANDDLYMEFRYSIHQAMQKGKQGIRRIFADLSKITGRDHGSLIEKYRTEEASVLLVAMGSVAGTAKDAVDELRLQGVKVGLIKIRCYRPFPYEDILQAIDTAKIIAVLDANVSMGSEGAVGMDLKAKLYGRKNAPFVFDVVAGLGGRSISIETIRKIVQLSEKHSGSGSYPLEPHWMDVDLEIIP